VRGIVTKVIRPPSDAIFINYRRQDTAFPATWLYDRLVERYGKDRVFKDIDSIRPGDDFVERITDVLNACTVLLALISDRWIAAVDEKGRRRLDDPGDYVRLEIETALNRNIHIIPILFEGARMPHKAELPHSLRKLSRRQAFYFRPSHLGVDTQNLLHTLDSVFSAGKKIPVPESKLAPLLRTAHRNRDTQIRRDRHNKADGMVEASARSSLSGKSQAAKAKGARLIRTLTGHAGAVADGPLVRGVDFSPDGRLLATAGNDGTVRFWNVVTGDTVRVTTDHQGSVMDVAFSPDGRLIASAGSDSKVRLWDTATGSAIRVMTGHSAPVQAVVFSPDGRLIASAGLDSKVRLWDTATGSAIRVMTGHSAPVQAVVFSSDGRLIASAAHDYTARLWNTMTGVAVRTFKFPGQSYPSRLVYGVAMSRNGRLLASVAADPAIPVWQVSNGSQVRTLIGVHGAHSVGFSPDGRLLATAGTGVRLWSTTTWEEEQVLECTVGMVIDLAFNRDGSMIAVAGFRGAELWG